MNFRRLAVSVEPLRFPSEDPSTPPEPARPSPSADWIEDWVVTQPGKKPPLPEPRTPLERHEQWQLLEEIEAIWKGRELPPSIPPVPIPQAPAPTVNVDDILRRNCREQLEIMLQRERDWLNKMTDPTRVKAVQSNMRKIIDAIRKANRGEPCEIPALDYALYPAETETVVISNPRTAYERHQQLYQSQKGK